MKTRIVAFSVVAMAVLTLSFGSVYQLGFSHGGAHERRHWIVSWNSGVVTARENPAHPVFKNSVRVHKVHMVNSISTPHLP